MSVVAYGMMLAKRCIIKLWKSDASPQFESWLREFIGVLQMKYQVTLNSLIISGSQF